MKKLLAIALIGATPLASARTWAESFDEAVERRSKSACESTYRRMYEACGLAGIYRGGQDYNKVISCRDQAQGMRRDCLDDVDAAIAEDREEARKKADEARRDQLARKKDAADALEIDRLRAIAQRRPADLELSCTRVSATRTRSGNFTYDPARFFEQLLVVQIWSDGVCLGTLGTAGCQTTASSIQGYSYANGSRFTISRVSGMMSITNSGLDMEATYNCQRAAAGVNKF